MALDLWCWKQEFAIATVSSRLERRIFCLNATGTAEGLNPEAQSQFDCIDLVRWRGCRNGGGYFRKEDQRYFLQRDRPYFLAIEDPQDPDNDLAKGSWNIIKVQKAFDFAYRQLSTPIEPSDSNLERIIR